MSSDHGGHPGPSEVDPSDEVQLGDRPGAGELLVEWLRKTWWILLLAFAAFGTLLAMAIFGVPYREVGIVAIIFAVVGPFAFAYIFGAIWYIDSEQRQYVLLADDDHESIGLLDVAKDYFRTFSVEGGELSDRDSGAGKVYIARSYEVRQETEVNPETGEEETVPVPTLVATWEAEADPWQLIEDRNTLQEQRERLVPLAKSGAKARAAADMMALENADRLAHATLLGAEYDEFVHLGSDPFDYDLGVRDDLLEDVGDLVREADADIEPDITPTEWLMGSVEPEERNLNGGVIADD